MYVLLLTKFVFVRDTSCRQTDALVPMRRSMHISQCNHSAHLVWLNQAAISKLQVAPALWVRTNKTVIPKILVSPAVELEPKSYRMQWKQCIYHTCCWICLSLWIRWQWGSMYCRWRALQTVSSKFGGRRLSHPPSFAGASLSVVNFAHYANAIPSLHDLVVRVFNYINWFSDCIWNNLGSTLVGDAIEKHQKISQNKKTNITKS